MKKSPVSAIATLCFLAFSSLAAADGFFYLTGKLSSTSVDADLEESFELILDGDDEGAAFGLGFRLGDYLAVELAYHDFGTVNGFASACPECLALTAPLGADTTAVSFSALPHLPITENLFAFGKLGVISWETSISDIAPGLENAFEDYSDEDLVYGLGLRYLLPGPLGVFAEFERFADSFETVSLGATLGF